MKKLLVLALLLCSNTGYAGFMDAADKLISGGEEIREQIPPAKDEASNEERHEAPAANEDRHYIQTDDFFVSEEAMEDRPWIYVHLAKMTVQPSAKTKGEAEFFRIKDGNKLWTKQYWRTRIARPEEIKLGAMVILFEGNSLNDLYQAPQDKSNARQSNWFMAKITDKSDLYKGYVTVSGGYKANPKNIRVLVGKK